MLLNDQVQLFSFATLPLVRDSLVCLIPYNLKQLFSAGNPFYCWLFEREKWE